MGFAKTTLSDAMELHRIGLLNSVGLTYFYFQTELGDWEQDFDPNEICKKIGISKSSFYRALSICQVHGYLSFETKGKLRIRNLKAAQDKGCVKTDKACVKSDTTSPKLTQPLQNSESARQNSESSTKTDTATPPKPLQSNDSGASTDIKQIKQLSSSIKSASAENPDDDDDDFENSFLEKKEQVKEKPIVGDRHKRMVKTLKAILEECSSDPEEWNGFFDWCEAELWPSFNKPVDNKIGWLRSPDPDSGLSRLEFNWDNFLSSQSNKTAPGNPEIDALWARARKLAGGSHSRSATGDFIDQRKEPRFYKAVWKVGIYKLSEIAENPRALMEAKQLFVETYENWVEPVEIVLSPEEQAKQDAHFEVMKERLLGKHSTNSLVGGIH